MFSLMNKSKLLAALLAFQTLASVTAHNGRDPNKWCCPCLFTKERVKECAIGLVSGYFMGGQSGEKALATTWEDKSLWGIAKSTAKTAFYYSGQLSCAYQLGEAMYYRKEECCSCMVV